jgi:hypothetical protein
MTTLEHRNGVPSPPRLLAKRPVRKSHGQGDGRRAGDTRGRNAWFGASRRVDSVGCEPGGPESCRHRNAKGDRPPERVGRRSPASARKLRHRDGTAAPRFDPGRDRRPGRPDDARQGPNEAPTAASQCGAPERPAHAICGGYESQERLHARPVSQWDTRSSVGPVRGIPDRRRGHRASTCDCERPVDTPQRGGPGCF